MLRLNASKFKISRSRSKQNQMLSLLYAIEHAGMNKKISKYSQSMRYYGFSKRIKYTQRVFLFDKTMNDNHKNAHTYT